MIWQIASSGAVWKTTRRCWLRGILWSPGGAKLRMLIDIGGGIGIRPTGMIYNKRMVSDILMLYS